MTATTLSHRLEYYALRGAVGALERLGIRLAGRVGELLGAFGYRFVRIRREVVEGQLRESFPDLPEEEIGRIAQASYEHLGRTTFETALLSTRSRQQILALFERVEGWEVVERALARGRGLILVSGHLGNWELGGSYLVARGLPVSPVVRPMQNPLFEEYLTETRGRLGIVVIPDVEAVKRVPRAVRDRRVVAFLVDQAAAGLASTWVPFFGRDAKTAKGAALFALRLEAPVVFGCALRQSDGRFTMHFEEVRYDLTGDREADVDRIVAAYTSTLERWIRRAPEQYFWHHRRWKHQRPATTPTEGERA